MGVNYNWTVDDIDRRIAVFEKKLALQSDHSERLRLHEIVASLSACKTMLSPLTDDMDNLPLPEVISENKLFFDSVESLIEPMVMFSNRMNFLPKVKRHKIARLNLKYGQIANEVKRFYSSIGGQFASSYNAIHSHLRTNHRFFARGEHEVCGTMRPVKHLKEIYSISAVDGSIEDVLNLIHEAAHGIEFINFYDYQLDDARKPFLEITSIFMELIAMEAFKGDLVSVADYNTILLAWATESYSACNLSLNLGRASHIGYYITDRDSRQIYETIGHDLRISPSKAAQLMKYDVGTEFMYGFSYVCAVGLWHIYRRDKEAALDILWRIISERCEYSEDFYAKMREWGLRPEEALEAHKLELKRASSY